MDATNKASHTGTETSIFNTLQTSQSGSINNVATNKLNLSQNSAKYIELDGTDDYIELSDTKNSSYTNITVGMWVMGDTAASGGNYWLAAPIDNSAGTFWINGGNGATKFGIRTNSEISSASTTTSSTSEFQYLTGTWDGSNIVFYKNASIIQTKSVTGTLMWSSTYNWNIGAYGGPFGAGGLNGNLSFSCFHFYNRALSANEVLHNYNALKSRFGI
jgi:hypothetical protein